MLTGCPEATDVATPAWSACAGVVSHDRAVLAVDLADDTQVVVVCDNDSRVLARRTWRCRPWQLDRALGWGAGRGVPAGLRRCGGGL